MNRATPARRPFQLVRGGGLRTGGEAEQLSRFLIETDPILIASLREEEHGLRRRKLAWGLAIFLGIAATLLALDRTQEAKVYFERALSLDADHVRSLNGLARCLKSEGRIGDAIAVWQGMSRRYPGVNYGTPGLAWTYYELGDYNQAAVYLARLVRRYPYDSRVIDALNVAVENIRSARSY
jgi:tetratricopeptide (TPR) repeat protein